MLSRSASAASDIRLLSASHSTLDTTSASWHLKFFALLLTGEGQLGGAKTVSFEFVKSIDVRPSQCAYPRELLESRQNRNPCLAKMARPKETPLGTTSCPTPDASPSLRNSAATR